MKKVMMFIGVVAGVCSLHAASVNWKLQFNSAEVGKTAYAVLASALTGKDMTKLTSDDVTGNALSWVNTAGTVFSDANTIVEKSGKGTGTYAAIKDDALTAGTAADIYLIVVDGDKYAIANGGSAYQVAAAQVYADGQTGSNVTANNSAAALSYTSFQSGGGGGGGTVDTPEPTSGLLLLVGAGMLALRRKQK